MDDPATALVTLNILSDQRRSRQIGTGASQETRKYELSTTVTFSLHDKTGKRVYGPTTVSSAMSHYVYSGQVLGNSQEEGTLYQSLQRSVIQQILFKLGSEEVKDALAHAQETN